MNDSSKSSLKDLSSRLAPPDTTITIMWWSRLQSLVSSKIPDRFDRYLAKIDTNNLTLFLHWSINWTEHMAAYIMFNNITELSSFSRTLFFYDDRWIWSHADVLVDELYFSNFRHADDIHSCAVLSLHVICQFFHTTSLHHNRYFVDGWLPSTLLQYKHNYCVIKTPSPLHRHCYPS